MGIDPITLSKALMAFRCAIGGFITIFLPVFFDQMGLDDLQIGIISTISPIGSVIGTPLWGAIADSGRGRRKKLMIILACCSWLTFASFVPISLLAPQKARFWLCIVAVCFNSFATISSLLDGLVVDQVPKNEYGRLRLWCAVGYGTAAGLIGVGMYFVPKITWVPYAAHFAPGLLSGIISITLMCFLQNESEKKPIDNVSIQEENQPDTHEEESKPLNPPVDEKQEPFCSKFRRLPFSFDLFLFVIVIFICGSCMGLVATFLFLFIEKSLHGSQLIMGVSVLVTCAFEVPVFYYAKNLLDHVSPDLTILISLASYIVRFGAYWLLNEYHGRSLPSTLPLTVCLANAWWILVPECLHGLTFALMWCSAVAKASVVVQGLNLNNFAVGSMSAVLTSGSSAGTFPFGPLI